jgi:hypothetical protein
MSVKVLAVVEGESAPVQIGGNWMSVGDAASDINGGDFWRNLWDRFPNGYSLKEIRIVFATIRQEGQ